MISLAPVKRRLKLSLTDTTYDTVLGELIPRATAIVGHELGRYLGIPAATTELRHGGTPLIVLRDDPTTGTPVTVQTRGGIGVAWETPESDTYELDGRALRHATKWPQGRANVRIAYTHGFPVDTGPAELQDLVIELVAMKFTDLDLDPALQSESLGDYSYTRRDLERIEAWPTLASRWRRMPV